MKGTKPNFSLMRGTSAKQAPQLFEDKKQPLSFRDSSYQEVEEDEPSDVSKYADLFDNHGMSDDLSEEDGEEGKVRSSSVSLDDQEEKEEEQEQVQQEQEKTRYRNQNQEESQYKEEKPVERWKMLYAQKEKYEIKKRQLKKEYEDQDKDPECTFKPKLLTENKKLASEVTNLPVHERNRLWQEKQQAKMKETSQKEKERNLNGCTFKPQVNVTNKKIKPTEMSTRGVNQFVKRQALARHNKEEKEALMSNPLSRLPECAIKKEGNVTVAKYPRSCVPMDRSIEVPALKKPSESFYPIAQIMQKTKSNTSQDSNLPSERSRNEKGLTNDLIHVSDIMYFDAIKKLREELYKIPINID